MDNIEIIKHLSDKNDHSIAIVRKDERKLLYKKYKMKSDRNRRRFIHERNVLLNNNWDFVPRLIDHDDDTLLIEFFDSIIGNPDDFERYVDEKIISSIVKKLLIIHRSPEIPGTKKDYRESILVFYIIFKLFPTTLNLKDILKIIFLMVIFHNKSRSFFSKRVNTKGDMTEVNILMNEDHEIKFIDFVEYSNYGFLFQDAVYLALHQDKKIDEMKWQKVFLHRYYEETRKEYGPVNRDYLGYWLLSTSLRQLYVRHMQYVNTDRRRLVERNITKRKMNIKKEHLKFFLNKKKRDKYIDDIIY